MQGGKDLYRWLCATLLVVAAVLLMNAAVALGASGSVLCGSSNIDGDHITRANDFQVRGIGCENAFRSATGYTDSTDAVNTTTPGTERFTAELYEWRYRWTCNSTRLAERHDGLETDLFRCHAQEELAGTRRGTVYMNFKWWLPRAEGCPPLAGAEPNETSEGVFATRNVRCSTADAWIGNAETLISRWVYAYADREGELYYHYYESEYGDGNAPGLLFDCTEFSPPGEPSAHVWDCFQPGRGFASKEYSWVERPTEEAST